MAIDLGIIGRFVTGDIAVDENSHYQQHYRGDADGNTKTGTGSTRRASMEIPFRGGQRLGAALRLIVLGLVFLGLVVLAIQRSGRRALRGRFHKFLVSARLSNIV